MKAGSQRSKRADIQHLPRKMMAPKVSSSRFGVLAGLAATATMALLDSTVKAAPGIKTPGGTIATAQAHVNEQPNFAGRRNRNSRPGLLTDFDMESSARSSVGLRVWQKTWNSAVWKWDWDQTGGSDPDGFDVQLPEWNENIDDRDTSSCPEDVDEKDSVVFGQTEADVNKDWKQGKKSGKSNDEECEGFSDTLFKLPWGAAVQPKHALENHAQATS